MKDDPVKAKIIELLPEIVELKYGCVVQYKGYARPFTYLRNTRGGKHAVLTPDHEQIRIFVTEFEILGRNVTLADVLRAIGNSRERHGFTIDAQGDKLVMFWSTKDTENPDHSTLLRERWNLTTDYDNQTQEVKDFIGRLLGITN